MKYVHLNNYDQEEAHFALFLWNGNLPEPYYDVTARLKECGQGLIQIASLLIQQERPLRTLLLLDQFIQYAACMGNS
jgi:hypothetical protein